MREPLTVGIIREKKHKEFRSPLTPDDVAWLKKRFIVTEVESSPGRIFSDRAYRRAGGRVVPQIEKARLLVGIKEPEPDALVPGAVYMVFSHTAKGQAHNRRLLRRCLDQKVTLIDFEKITDPSGQRLVYFGRMAGFAGTVDALCYLGRKLAAKGVRTPFAALRPAHAYRTADTAKRALSRAAAVLKKRGLPGDMVPFVVGITGHGRVCAGVKEALDFFHPVHIHPRDMKRFVAGNRGLTHAVCQIIFDREEKLRRKDGKHFYFEEYIGHPRRFESGMAQYLPNISLLVHTSYWEPKYPKLVTGKMVRELYGGDFRLEFIADIACDVNGSIELNHKTTTVEDPVYTYDPKTGRYTDGLGPEGIAILARDNLPAELPKDASREFSLQIRDYIYQLAAHGVTDVTGHVALPREIREAVITQAGRLTPPYRYLIRGLKG